MKRYRIRYNPRLNVYRVEVNANICSRWKPVEFEWKIAVKNEFPSLEHAQSVLKTHLRSKSVNQWIEAQC